MNSTQTIIEDWLLLIAESKRLHRRGGPVHELLASLETEFGMLRQRCLRSGTGYKIAVVGLGNVGKSTMINALLGAEVAPVSNGPCTASVVEFKHGPLRIDASLPERLLPETWRFAKIPQLHEKLCELVAHDGSSGRRWTRVVVSLPAEILSDGLILCDTPGFGAASQMGEEDDQVVAGFLRQDAAQVFWVVMADRFLADEVQFYQQVLVDRCDDLVVTNAEDFDERDRERWLHRYVPQFKRRPSIYFVAGREALPARANGDIAAWEASGMAVVEERIRGLSRAAGRVETVLQALGPLAEAMLEHAARLALSRSHLFSRSAAAQLASRYRDAAWIQPWRLLLE